MVKYKLVDKILNVLGKLPVLNKETSLFWVGWTHCPDYAEAATEVVL